MFDEDHPPVDPREIAWIHEILGGDADYPPEQEAAEDLRPVNPIVFEERPF